MDRDLAMLQEKTEIINRKRKQTQEESVDKLYSTQYQALELQMKNYQIQVGMMVWGWSMLMGRDRAMRWRSI